MMMTFGLIVAVLAAIFFWLIAWIHRCEADHWKKRWMEQRWYADRLYDEFIQLRSRARCRGEWYVRSESEN